MITAPSLIVAAVRLKLQRVGYPSHDYVASFGLACAVLIDALMLAAGSNLDLSPSSAQSSLKPNFALALNAVQASMVELPKEIEAAAIAQHISKIRMLLLENQQLGAALRKVEADHARLDQQHKAELLELHRHINLALSSARWLIVQQKDIEADLSATTIRHHQADYQMTSTLPHAADNGSTSSNHFGTTRLSTTDTHPSLVPPVRLIASQIARGLTETRRQAISSGKERAFIVDVERRSIQTSEEVAPVPLDYNLSVALNTARSELLSPHRGRIRFFDDGSSTGGQIALDLYGIKATVNVSWSTGDITVD